MHGDLLLSLISQLRVNMKEGVKFFIPSLRCVTTEIQTTLYNPGKNLDLRQPCQFVEHLFIGSDNCDVMGIFVKQARGEYNM